MARNNPENKNKNTPAWPYIVGGIIVVVVIVLLYYGFFSGATDNFEDQEDPATLEQQISVIPQLKKEALPDLIKLPENII